jgi:hypothetical protein
VSVIDKLASRMNINNEIPNQKLAMELVERRDLIGIKEIIDNLNNKDKKVQNDCIKVAYEIGYINPGFISEFVNTFINLTKSKNNRMAWGAAIALATIAEIRAEELYNNIESIFYIMERGSVISIDNGVKILARVASMDEEYNNKIFPYLINHLKTCRPKEIPQHSESIMIGVKKHNKDEFMAVLKGREDMMTAPQLARIKKIYKLLDKNLE